MNSETPNKRVLGYSAAMMIALLLPAFNLRPGITGVGPVLAEITESLSMSATVAGVLTAMPVVTFGVFALATPALVSWFGLHRLTLISITVTGLGLTIRPWVDHVGWFIVLTSVGLSGLATLNVILPSLVKRHFANKVGFATALYTTAMGLGLTAGALLTYPIAARVGAEGWRFGLTGWGITALVCGPIWIVVSLRFPRAKEAANKRIPVSFRSVAQTRLGWLMALFFGLQSLQAYALFGWFAQMNRDAGFSASSASVLLATLSFASVPAGFVAAWLASREQLQGRIVVGLTSLYLIGYVGILLAPTGNWIWAWTLLLGVGLGVFPVALALIGLKSQTVEGTAALSAFTQSIGYGIAALGPFGMGVIHDITGGWTTPLCVLIALASVQIVIGWLVVKQPHLEVAQGLKASLGRPSESNEG